MWKSLRSPRRTSPVRGSRRLAPVEALEVRTLLTGEFSELPALGFAAVRSPSIAWGDMDSDGDLDAALTGYNTSYTPVSKVYRNNGNNTYTDLNAGLTGVYTGSVAWGDADNDSDLDILLTGANAGNGVAKVYLNGGGGAFTEAPNTGLSGVFASSAAWGDYNNDGRLDALIAGRDTIGNVSTKIYRNNGNNTFTDINAGLTGVRFGSVAWGDFDNDGNRDLVVAGDEINVNSAKVYHNNGDGTFSNINAGLTPSGPTSVAVGDTDNDGDLDILMTNGTSAATLYRNDGNNVFTEVANTGLGGLSGFATLGDTDNDGDLDVLLSGQNASYVRKTELYRNNGNNSFTLLDAGLTGVINGSAAIGDADSDGDLDLLIAGSATGFGASGFVAKYYRNNSSSSNTVPNVPTNLQSNAATNGSITFSWTAATDSQTPAMGLSYNLRVGTTPGGSDVVASMSDTDNVSMTGPNGFHRVPITGPVQGTSYTLKNVDLTKKYYWSVQAVDTAFAGSAFAAEQTFVGAFADVGSGSIPGLRNGSVAWGDYDNDGQLDALVTGSDSSNTYVSRVYHNNGNNTFTDIGAGLVGVAQSSVAWGDYDNDGKLDILLTGFTASPNRASKVYHNNGNGTFTDIAAGLTPVSYSSVDWGDIDNDGDLDILLTGAASGGVRTAKVYRNTNGTFAEILNTGLPRIKQGSVAWGDANNDGYQDILLTGNDTTNAPIAGVYYNNKDGTFTNIPTGLAGVYRSSVAWGDYDNDGKLDILLTGKNSSGAYVSSVYRNDGGNVFSDIGPQFTGIAYGSATWGDIDNDGKLDILTAGFDTSTTTVTKVYRNAGGGSFTNLNTGLPGRGYSSAAWGDVNSDGKLDVLLAGTNTISSAPDTKIYRNNAIVANSAPGTPSYLTFSFPTTTSLTMTWNAPTDSSTPAAGLSYNLRVGTSPGASNVFSSMANTANGSRRVPTSGPIQGTSFTLTGLTAGQSYYWSVQAIDTSFAGSPFASEQGANSSNTMPTIGGAVANQAVNDTATINPLSTLTVTDPDNQNMFARITILNGLVRGDFTPSSATGWTRTVVGNDIKYERFYNPQANIGSIVQAAVRGFVFQPRTNAIKPNTTEATAFTVYVTDGINSASNSTTSVITTSVNNVPLLGGTTPNIAMNDNATVNPFATLTVSDADMQEMLISVTILNGTVRGDFTPASTAGWAVRYVLGNNITYKRYFSPQANVGAAAQAAFRALVFQPRQNAITPGTTEATDFQVTVSDGVAPAVLGSPNTRVTTTSVNDVPAISGTVAGQTMNDNQTKAVFSTFTLTDPDTQDIVARVTITNGNDRGDFTSASASGWTRGVIGNDIVYSRYFSPVVNIGATVQTAIRALIFQPRNIFPNSNTETTSFTVFINDGTANTTNSTTSVITTGVERQGAPAAVETPLFLDRDINTVIVPTIPKPRINSLAKLLRKTR
jgi:predicted nucleotidyltransferase